MLRNRAFPLRLFCLATLVATPATAQDADSPYVYAVPQDTGDGWDVAGLGDVGADGQLLSQLVGEIRAQRLSNLHSILVVKNGFLVFEEYFEGEDEYRGQSLGVVEFDQSTLHDLRSVTKSVTSALVGIAVDQGHLEPARPIGEVLRANGDVLNGKSSLTLLHLLTMTSGLEWDESTYPYTDPRNSETAMDLSNSSVEFVLTRDLVTEPGTQFGYCGGCTMLLAAAVREATSEHLDQFAETHLFVPLGISEFEWLRHRDGLPVAASGLRLRPRDLAKIGQLYADQGRWKGRAVLPTSWVEESIRPQVQLDSISAYGYQWWVDLEPINGELAPVAVARGNGGQRVYVVPELSLVAVITAGNYNSPASRLSEQAFWRFILPALSSPNQR